MSEPIRKIKPNPESFSPKNKPEILNMMEENAKNDFPENYMLEKAAHVSSPQWVGIFFSIGFPLIF